MKSDFKICKNCIIDSIAYPEIKLDKNGVCDICEIVKHRKNKTDNFNISEIISKIKSNKDEYNCAIALSGGVDSAFLALKAKEWGLRPLIIHIDSNWNSETSVQNIEKIIDFCGFDLYTYVIKWSEQRDVILSYLRSSVVDIDIANEMAVEASF